MSETKTYADLQKQIEELQYDSTFWRMVAIEQMFQIEDAHAIIERNGCPEVCIVRERMLKEQRLNGEAIPEELAQEELEEAQYTIVSRSRQNRCVGHEDDSEETQSPMLDEAAALEKNRIVEALQDTEGNVTKAAKLVGIPRTTLASKIQKHKLRALVSSKRTAASIERLEHGPRGIK